MGEDDIRDLIEEYHQEELTDEELLEIFESYYGITRLERWIFCLLLLILTIIESIRIFAEVIWR